jgi:anaerobic magnesium-protoporphyrin IX monomethyl ester cyclase
MCDDIFGLKPGWVKQFRDELNQRKLKIKYKIQSRADLLLQEDNIEALVAAGLDEAWIGAESGSQEVLDAMDKGITIDQIRSSTRILKSFGVKVAFFIQFGYLGETMQDIKKTFHLVLDLMPDKLGVSVSYPLPGTKFFDKVKADLANKQNWVDSDDLDMMFKNTYKPKFYKVLHRYLHNRYVLKRGLMISKELLRHPATATEGKIRHIASGLYNLPKSMINYLMLQYVRFGSK